MFNMKALQRIGWVLVLPLLFVMIITSQVKSQDRGVLPKPPKVDRFEFKMLPSPMKMMGIEQDNSYMVIKEDFTVQMRDGILLDCSKFYPSEPNIYLPNGYPVVIMVHGYGDRKETLEGFASAQAQYNYVVYTYSVRGQGNSGGLSNLMSIVEAEDLIEFVDYVRNDNVGADTSLISITGGSQGGTVPYIAACNGMNVKGIISALTCPKFATSWIENGSVKMSFLWTIEYTPDSARYNPLVDRMSDWVYASGVKSDKWDSLAYWMPIGRDFSDQVQNNTTTMLIENSWQDYFFNAKYGIESFPSISQEHIVYMGAVMGHGGDISESENQWHMQFFNDWYFHNIWGWASNYPNYDRYQIAYTTYPKVNGDWSFEHDSSPVWPPAGVVDTKLYMRRNSKLSSTPEGSRSRTANFKNDVASNYKLIDAVYSEFTGADFDAKFKKSQITFDSDPLTTATYLVGTPKVHLKYRSRANLCQYNFQIFEVAANGQANFVTRINYTDRNYSANQVRTADIDGLAHGHKFSAGSKIRIVVTNLDTTPEDSSFLNTNPHVLPVMTRSTRNDIYLRDSYIQLPLRAEGSDQVFANVPQPKCQNYPNPFNPSTNIRFELPEGFQGLVTLKIYDITGREVANLVHQNLVEGIHEYNWDASAFASGVYFSRLTAGSSVVTNRMLLIK